MRSAEGAEKQWNSQRRARSVAALDLNVKVATADVCVRGKCGEWGGEDISFSTARVLEKKKDTLHMIPPRPLVAETKINIENRQVSRRERERWRERDKKRVTLLAGAPVVNKEIET